METIGLIAAMRFESDALLRLIQGWKRTAVGSFRGHSFQLENRDCLLVTSGMGSVRAADATRALLKKGCMHLLISFGIAGAVEDDLQIGDVVVSGNTCMLINGFPGQLQSLVGLSETAYTATAQALQPDGVQLLTGTAITTRGSQVVGKQLGALPHPVLEMETAGVVQVAIERGIPLLSIRSISDGPLNPIPIDLETVMDEEYNLRVGKMALVILRHPQIIFQSQQVMKNYRKAAEIAAKALVAILSLPDPITSQNRINT